jgi:hypothetical protein
MTGDLFAHVKEISIEQVVRLYWPSIELKRSGRDLVGSCPIHPEKTPSFHVNLEKNSWHCFGACAGGGTTIDILLKGGIASTPLDAAKELASRFGIEIEKPKRKAGALTVAQYAEFCAVPESFLRETFELTETDKGLLIPYKDATGAVVSIQRRHRLEKGKTKDGRFSWRKGDRPIPYGLWLLPEGSHLSALKGRLVIVEGASDMHVLTYSGIAALGIPGATSFKPEMVSALLPFGELALIQEPGKAGEQFVSSITAALKSAEYKGGVKAVSLLEKDPRALWLKSKDKARFAAELDRAIQTAAPIELYPPIPLSRDLIDELEALFRRHIVFKDKDFALLLALWTLGTYVFFQFSHFGYLHIVSPVMRCAKTLLLDILAEVVANGTGRTSNLTESVVFHLANKGRTFLIDELDNLRNQDREKYGAIMAVLNAGFQAGAKVYRMKRTEEGFVEEAFNAYSPKAMAGINSLSDTLADRCFRIPMTRKAPSEKVERFSLRRQRKELPALRSRLQVWASEREKKIGEVYDSIDEITQKDDTLRNALDDRFLDTSEPLLSIALFADIEHSNGGVHVSDRLTKLLIRMANGRSQDAEDSSLATMVKILSDVIGKETKKFIPSNELVEKVQPEIGWCDSKKKLANYLSRFGLFVGRDPSGTIRGYTVKKEWIDDIQNRYLCSLPDFEVSDPSETLTGREVKADL